MKLSSRPSAVTKATLVENELLSHFPGLQKQHIDLALSDKQAAVRAIASAAFFGPLSTRILAGEFEDDDIAAAYSKNDEDPLEERPKALGAADPVAQQRAIEASGKLVDNLLAMRSDLQAMPLAVLETRQASRRPSASASKSDGLQPFPETTPEDGRIVHSLQLILRACLIDGYGYRDDPSAGAQVKNRTILNRIHKAMGKDSRSMKTLERHVASIMSRRSQQRS